MRSLLQILTLLALGAAALFVLDAMRHQPAPAAADSPASVLVMGRARPRAAKPLDCSCGPDCRCVAGECGSPNCPSLKVAVTAAPKKTTNTEAVCPCDCCCCQMTYAEGVREAKRDRKPLVVWVGCCCPCREKELKEFVHCYTSGLKGKPVPYVAVLKYSGYGDGGWSGRGFTSIPTAEQVRAAVREPMAAKKEACATCPGGVCPAPQVRFAPPPMFFPAPPPMMPMGGFGGGGCAGGGCGH